MNRILAALHRRGNRRGQATTELAIFGFVMLIALASLLRYGQLMNQQQAMRMHAFRQALSRAYEGYGSGLGGASYTSLKHIHMVSLFRDHYDGSQRATVSGGATVLWDPDLMYADSGDRPSSYVEVNGLERNLGSARREEITTDSTVYVNRLEEYRSTDNFGSENRLYADVDEYVQTRIKLEEGADIVFDHDNTFITDETWATPW